MLLNIDRFLGDKRLKASASLPSEKSGRSMAHTARKDSEKKEYFDPPDVLEQKVETLAQWVKESNHIITFTVSQRRLGNGGYTS